MFQVRLCTRLMFVVIAASGSRQEALGSVMAAIDVYVTRPPSLCEIAYIHNG